jgi:glycosyltransferase involved in cell wall biosynthesis
VDALSPRGTRASEAEFRLIPALRFHELISDYPVSNARNLVLWLLEQGYTPQHLKPTLDTASDLDVAIKHEIDRLINEGQPNIAQQLQDIHQPSQEQPTILIKDSNLNGYANAAVLKNRLIQLNDTQGIIRSKELGNVSKVLATSKSYLKKKQINQGMHLLISAASHNPYEPWLEDGLAHASAAEEDWISALAHWTNIAEHGDNLEARAAAQSALETTRHSDAVRQQKACVAFGHLLFEEAQLKHKAETRASHNRQKTPESAAEAFWQHQPGAEQGLTAEINPQIWDDFAGSSLQHAARYLLRNKLFQGKNWLEAICDDGGIDPDAIRRRCRQHFSINHYLQQRPGEHVNADNALDHFIHEGWKKELNPHPSFSIESQLKQEPLLKIYKLNPFYYDQANHAPNPIDKAMRQSIKELSTGRIVPTFTSKTSTTNRHIRRFPNSHYFDHRFTWFNKRRASNTTTLTVHVVIPDFAKGGGGHMTIFRMVNQLERKGHQVTIWVIDPDRPSHSADLRDDVIKYFLQINAKVLPLDPAFYFSSGDCLIATGWQTVENVKQAKGFRQHYYFVQDYEPYFYARGSEAVQAEDTYRQDLACICASPWLAETMRTQFGLWTRHLWLAYDTKHYCCDPDELKIRLHRQQQDGTIFHIAVYARMHTARRCVELAIEGLNELYRHRSDVIVHLFGDTAVTTDIRFPAINHGILDHEELAELYKHCDLGLSLSATNYSLLPQEMMASGLPVVDLAVDSTQAIYPDDVITLAPPSAAGIANSINQLLNEPPAMLKQANQALEWVQQFSWESAGEAFEQALIDRLSEQEGSSSPLNIDSAQTAEQPLDTPSYKAAIVVPTYNAGAILKQVLDAIEGQQAPWPFQCIFIDSGSSDQTWEELNDFALRHEHVSLHQIENDNFQHGHTRNQGVAWSDAEFVAFITQDAIPANHDWLYNLVTALEHNPKAAGAFGRHIAHDRADRFERDELIDHFRGFDQFPVALSLASNQALVKSNDQGWRKVLHFYSDNNSCLRKAAWTDTPLPCVPYGEDQLWAEMIIRRGYEKLYVKDAVVKHSHRYTTHETYERSKTEADFFATCFNYRFHPTPLEMYAGIAAESKQAMLKFIKKNCELSELTRRLKAIHAKHLGWYAGTPKAEQ